MLPGFPSFPFVPACVHMDYMLTNRQYIVAYIYVCMHTLYMYIAIHVCMCYYVVMCACVNVFIHDGMYLSMYNIM